ncbi:MAG: FecR domain-containing protein [Bacteroidota bacterium]|nr:FecR domain-containing protein [Bacteroidota bacterium]
MEKNLHDMKVMNQLKGFSIPWKKSQEDVWQELEPLVSAREAKVVHIASRNWIRAVAAILILLISTGLFLRFFERQLESAYGEHLTHQLPDGSVIELNSGSSLSYHPFWWRFERSLSFEGEGYFIVQKGTKFSVESDLAATQVLGTSFTIYSRDNDYQVTCHTGKVQVFAFNSETSAVLSPNQIARLESDGNLELSSQEALPDPMPWKNMIFEFTGTPLKDVLDEIQRQYDVIVNYPDKLNHFYTGGINANRDLTTTLNLVCKPFKITFEKISEGEYKIFENTAKQN